MPPSEYGRGQRDEQHSSGCACTVRPIGPRALAARAPGARALANHSTNAGILASTPLAHNIPTACKTDEKGDEEAMRGGAVEGRGGGWQPPSISSPPLTSTAGFAATLNAELTADTTDASTTIAPGTQTIYANQNNTGPPSPTAAPADLLTPPPIAVSPPPDAADEYAEPVQCMVTSDGPQQHYFF